MIFLDSIAWAGVFVALFCQWLVSSQKASPVSVCVLILNWVSFLMMAVANLPRGAYQAIAISFCFCLIVTWGFWKKA